MLTGFVSVVTFETRMGYRKASKIVEKLIDGELPLSPLNYCERISRIDETPQYLPGAVSYQADVRFPPVSRGNLKAYTILGKDDVCVYMVDPGLEFGYVFDRQDYESKSPSCLAVMALKLRPAPLQGYRQAYNLRIRQSYARHNVTTTWYLLYTQKYGGIVSDYEHLTGGKRLWRSLVNNASWRNMKAELYDADTHERIDINKDTPDSHIWSTDRKRRNQVIVLLTRES